MAKKIFFSLGIGVSSCVGVVLVFIGFLRIQNYRNTVYAPQFNSRSFKEINRGQTKESVENVLGKPLSAKEWDGLEYWYYSDRKNDGDYFIKAVVVRNGRVVDMVDRLYID